MFKETIFNYLDADDSGEFEEYWGTEFQDMLVSGSRTSYRLEKYLACDEYYRIRVILTALVRDFNLPSVRFTYAIALTIYAMTNQNDGQTSEVTKNIADAELALLLQHLLTDNEEDGETEKDLFDKNVEMVASRWNEYLRAPKKFVL